MKIITQKQFDLLRINGQPENVAKDKIPVVKLFLPRTACTWLLTEIDQHNDNIAFGFCDLGLGFPELGTVDINELSTMRVNGFKVERDKFFCAKYPMSVYVKAANSCGHITNDETILKQFT